MQLDNIIISLRVIVVINHRRFEEVKITFNFFSAAICQLVLLVFSLLYLQQSFYYEEGLLILQRHFFSMISLYTFYCLNSSPEHTDKTVGDKRDFECLWYLYKRREQL